MSDSNGTKSDGEISVVSLTKKIKELQNRQQELRQKLEEQYSDKTYRELSLVNHAINVSKQRNLKNWTSNGIPSRGKINNASTY
ncbi:MAG: hypothetical protein NTZ69_15910 [Bacteroidia bacterium]|nr:hypothetical protein [Bacteroidia bacterium]